MGLVDDLVVARATFERGDWVTAFETWSDVDPDALGPEDLHRLGTVAQLLGKDDACIDALQRAYQAYLDRGDLPAAVRCAYWLSMFFATNEQVALAAGWTARADRLVEQIDEDVVERGYVRFLHLFACVATADWEGAFAQVREVVEYGRRFGDPDLLGLGLSAQGRLTIGSGRVPDGLALFDEAMAGVAAGELSPVIAGAVYCVMIEGCQEVADLGRAADWTAALTRWCSTQPGLVAFTGQCAVHRGQIMRLRGSVREAVEEFDSAIRRYQASPARGPIGLAAAEKGDALRILGELEAAEASYEVAFDHGYEPQPGLALLWLAQGRTEAAIGAARRLLAETGGPVGRSRVLAGVAEVLLACGAGDEARSVSVELEQVAEEFGCSGLQAVAAFVCGGVELDNGDPSGALPYLRKAAGLWRRLDAPYETARVRLQIGRALAALDDEVSAASELAAARRAFEELGVPPPDQDARGGKTPLPAGLTAREAEVLRLVASGQSNAQIASALVLSEKTVARHLSNIFAKLEVGSRTAAAAFAFEHQLV